MNYLLNEVDNLFVDWRVVSAVKTKLAPDAGTRAALIKIGVSISNVAKKKD